MCECEAISRHPCLSSDPCPLHLTGCGQCRPCSHVLSSSSVWSKGDAKAPGGLSGEAWPSVSPQGEVVCSGLGWPRGGPSLDDREESGAQALSRPRSHVSTPVRPTGGRQSGGWGGRGACGGTCLVLASGARLLLQPHLPLSAEALLELSLGPGRPPAALTEWAGGEDRWSDSGKQV